MKYDDLTKIAELRDRGILTEEEFQREKTKILQNDGISFSQFFQSPDEPLLFGMKEDTYCTLMHLSQFLIFFFPPLGVIVPMTLWFLGREKSEWVDLHGRTLFNWWISFLIYFAICVGLCMVWIGYPLIPVLLVCAVIFTIVTAIKTSEGIVRAYPLSFDFFGVGERGSQSHRTAKSQAEKPNQKTPDEKPPQNFDSHFNPDKYR